MEKLERSGIIVRSDSPWAAPLVLVRKPNGKVILCVDYRKVNSVTVGEPYYIPTFDKIANMVGQAKMDLAKGFHQVGVKPADHPKLAFSCPFGKFTFMRMPFGLTNAPSIFQRLMDVVLAPCKGFCQVYIDDIVVASGTWVEHLKYLEEVLICLQVAGLTCHSTKCEFGKAKIEFLGHVIGGGVVSIPEHRVSALREIQRPRTRKQLLRFLGAIGYYRRFIADIHKWSALLTPATSSRSDSVVRWTEEMEAAFQLSKGALCDVTCLCIPVSSDIFVLETDASGTGVGAVLSADRMDVLSPVEYYSKQLQGSEKLYSAQELEGLGLFRAITHFTFYLYGNRFTVVTDHKGLVTLAPQSNKRLLNWALKLADYDFRIMYREGKLNVDPDLLSRLSSDLDCDDGVNHHQKEGGGRCRREDISYTKKSVPVVAHGREAPSARPRPGNTYAQ